MVDELGATLKALADPNRRRIMTILTQEGPMPVGELASRFDMSLNAVSKHIKTLEAAGLIVRRVEWREHIISASGEPLEAIDNWLSTLRSNWEVRLEVLAEVLKKENDDDQ